MVMLDLAYTKASTMSIIAKCFTFSNFHLNINDAYVLTL